MCDCVRIEGWAMLGTWTTSVLETEEFVQASARFGTTVGKDQKCL